MKLSGAAAQSFLRTPDTDTPGVLLHGPEAGLTTLRRQELVRTVAEGDAMRVTDLDPATIPRDPAALDEALRARGFFPGRRVVLLDNAKDAVAAVIADLADDLTAEDAFLIVTAGQLNTRSALRKLFEGHAGLKAIALYPDAITPGEISEKLRSFGCRAEVSRDCLSDLAAVLADTDPGVCHQALEKIALSLLHRDDEIGFEDVLPQLPPDRDTEMDTLIDHVLDGRPEGVGPALRRLHAGGTTMAQILILLSRRFADLLALNHAQDGIDAAIGRLRPPVFGPRRRRIGQHARQWSARVEDACRMLFDLERQLRSSGTRPERAMVERCLLRLAMMGARQR
ncbi:MAG: DNA polymerase III subunit delta [Pseudomonadota bacterium]